MTGSEYGDSKNLDDLLALLEEMKAEELASAYAFHMAVGQFADSDQLETADCVVTVLENRLFSMALTDELARQKDAIFISMTVNATMMNAWRVWKKDYDRLYQAAVVRLSTDPQSRHQLRQELEQNRRS